LRSCSLRIDGFTTANGAEKTAGAAAGIAVTPLSEASGVALDPDTSGGGWSTGEVGGTTKERAAVTHGAGTAFSSGPSVIGIAAPSTAAAAAAAVLPATTFACHWGIRGGESGSLSSLDIMEQKDKERFSPPTLERKKEKDY
jgi:hypothetical protein